MGNKYIFSDSGSFFTIGTTTVYLTDMSFNEAFDRVETTDTSTSGDGKEYKTGRAERTFTIDAMYDRSTTDLTLNSVAAVTMSFAGKVYLGQGALYSKAIQGTIDDVIKASYEGAFNGAVTVVSASV